jgi:hypothetical protein
MKLWKKKEAVVEQSKSCFPAQHIKLDAVKPDDWLVVELGQSPVHCLWFCNLYNMETKKQIFVEELDTAQEALSEAIASIEQGEK